MNHDQSTSNIKIMRLVSMLIMAWSHYNVHRKGSLVQIKISFNFVNCHNYCILLAVLYTINLFNN